MLWYEPLPGRSICLSGCAGVSKNADLGRAGCEEPQNHIGNNHGSIAKIGEKYYIFWHRHTHGGQFSRQGCADELKMREDGTFEQAEITSCGLNQGPLPANNTYQRQRHPPVAWWGRMLRKSAPAQSPFPMARAPFLTTRE